MIDIFTERPAGDLLSRTVRVTLGGQEFVLPVLRIGGNRRWKASLEASLSALVDGLMESGDDMAAVLAALGEQVDALLDLLTSYDESGVLPSRSEIEETAYESELVAAVREVWRAANPLVVSTLVTAMTAAPSTSESSPPTSLPAPLTGGPPPPSRPKSPTSSSSPTSTPRTNGSARSSRARSKRSVKA